MFDIEKTPLQGLFLVMEFVSFCVEYFFCAGTYL